MAAGVGPTVAAKMMGHSPTMFMETYTHLLPEASKEAAALVDAFMAAQPAAAAAAFRDGAQAGHQTRRAGRPRRTR